MVRILAVLSLAFSFALAPCASAQTGSGLIRALVVTGANNHDWEYTAPELKKILEESGRFEVEITEHPATTLADAEKLKEFDVFVLDYNGPRWGEPAETNFLEAVRSGTGVSVIHAANNAFPGWVEYEKMVALCWRKGTGHGRFHAFDVAMSGIEHPLTRKMGDMRAHPDELYHNLVHMHGVDFEVLANAHSSKESKGTGKREPMVIVLNYGKGRVFHTPLGHVWRNQPQTRASFQDPQFRWLVSRGTEWAATGANALARHVPNYLTIEDKQKGFRLLFDGKTTKGWRGFRKDGFPEQGWVVENGCLRHIPKGGGGDLITVDTFENFELRFEWAVAKGANSGVIYRCSEEAGASWQTGPEYQIYDDPVDVEPKHSAGALYAIAAPNTQRKHLMPPGVFNTGRIIVFRDRIEHWLNGDRIVNMETNGDLWKTRVGVSKFGSMPGFWTVKKGHIALQDHGDGVWYRSMKIRELTPREPAKELKRR